MTDATTSANSVAFDLLARFAAWPSDDPAKTDLELACLDCGEVLCDIEAEDSFEVLARCAAEHFSSQHEVSLPA